MNSPLLLTTPRTITVSGNFVCMAVRSLHSRAHCAIYCEPQRFYNVVRLSLVMLSTQGLKTLSNSFFIYFGNCIMSIYRYILSCLYLVVLSFCLPSFYGVCVHAKYKRRITQRLTTFHYQLLSLSEKSMLNKVSILPQTSDIFHTYRFAQFFEDICKNLIKDV